MTAARTARRKAIRLGRRSSVGDDPVRPIAPHPWLTTTAGQRLDALSADSGSSARAEVGFAVDSLLEGSGFELPVRGCDESGTTAEVDAEGAASRLNVSLNRPRRHRRRRADDQICSGRSP